MGKLRDRWGRIPVVVKVSTAYAVCSVLQRSISFITLPLFTRLLTQQQYGQYTIYSSWMGILTIFITLNLAYGSFSTAMVKFEKDRNGYISSVEGICLALSAAFLLIYLPFRNLWNRIFELPTLLICVMVLEMLSTTAIQLWSGRLRFEFKYKAVIAVTLVMAVVAPLSAFLLVCRSAEKGYARILGYAAVHVAIGGSVFVANAVRGRKLWNRGYWEYALRFNIPLIAYYVSQVIFNQSDRIMISHMVGTDKAAVYGVAYALAMVLNFVLNAINNAYVPWLYGKIKAGNQKENRPVSLMIAFLMAVLLSGVIWFAPEIIRVMAGARYAEAVYVVAPVAVSLLLLFYAQLFINVEFYYEEKKKLVGASIGAALFNIVANAVFIRWFGYVAAAYTTLASYVIFAWANLRAMRSVLEAKGVEDNANDYRGMVLLFLGFCAASALGTALYGVLPARIAIALAVLVGIVAKRSLFIGYYRRIRRER